MFYAWIYGVFYVFGRGWEVYARTFNNNCTQTSKQISGHGKMNSALCKLVYAPPPLFSKCLTATLSPGLQDNSTGRWWVPEGYLHFLLRNDCSYNILYNVSLTQSRACRRAYCSHFLIKMDSYEMQPPSKKKKEINSSGELKYPTLNFCLHIRIDLYLLFCFWYNDWQLWLTDWQNQSSTKTFQVHLHYPRSYNLFTHNISSSSSEAG